MIFRWSAMFRPFPRLRKTAIAMIDPRPGDAILFVGAADADLAGECGAVAGLNGRTVVTDANASAASRVETAAGKAGALVEFTAAPPATLPFETGTFAVVVVPDFSNWPGDERQTRFMETYRVAQPGARIVLLVSQKRGMLWSAPAKDTPARDQILHLYTRAGAVAARELANTDGVAYYEGRKPR